MGQPAQFLWRQELTQTFLVLCVSDLPASNIILLWTPSENSSFITAGIVACFQEKIQIFETK